MQNDLRQFIAPKSFGIACHIYQSVQVGIERATSAQQAGNTKKNFGNRGLDSLSKNEPDYLADLKARASSTYTPAELATYQRVRAIREARWELERWEDEVEREYPIRKGVAK